MMNNEAKKINQLFILCLYLCSLSQVSDKGANAHGKQLPQPVSVDAKVLLSA